MNRKLAAATAAAGALAIGGALLLFPPTPPPTLTLTWTGGPATVETSSNSTTWGPIFTGSSPLILPATNPAAFFRAALLSAPVILAWDPSPSTNVTGYFVYFGPSSGNYTNKADAGNVLTWPVTIPNGSRSYFVVTAYNAAGLESLPSNEVWYDAAAHARLSLDRAP